MALHISLSRVTQDWKPGAAPVEAPFASNQAIGWIHISSFSEPRFSLWLDASRGLLSVSHALPCALVQHQWVNSFTEGIVPTSSLLFPSFPLASFPLVGEILKDVKTHIPRLIWITQGIHLTSRLITLTIYIKSHLPYKVLWIEFWDLELWEL